MASMRLRIDDAYANPGLLDPISLLHFFLPFSVVVIRFIPPIRRLGLNHTTPHHTYLPTYLDLETQPFSFSSTLSISSLLVNLPLTVKYPFSFFSSCRHHMKHLAFAQGTKQRGRARLQHLYLFFLYLSGKPHATL